MHKLIITLLAGIILTVGFVSPAFADETTEGDLDTVDTSSPFGGDWAYDCENDLKDWMAYDTPDPLGAAHGIIHPDFYQVPFNADDFAVCAAMDAIEDAEAAASAENAGDPVLAVVEDEPVETVDPVDETAPDPVILYGIGSPVAV